MDTHSALMCGHNLVHADVCAGHIAIANKTHSQSVVKMHLFSSQIQYMKEQPHNGRSLGNKAKLFRYTVIQLLLKH